MRRAWLAALFCCLAGTSWLAPDACAKIKRTASGVADLTGFYDSGTLTPLDRLEAVGDKQFMTREEANERIAGTRAFLSTTNQQNACHGANYAMGNILRGARLPEKEELMRRSDSPGDG